MTGARAPFARSLPFLSIAILAASCGGEPARGRPPGEASLAVITPSEGTIVFYDPKPRAGSFNKGLRRQASTIIITTEARKGRRPEESAQTAAGTIPKEGSRERPTERDVKEKIFEEARLNSAFAATPQEFKQLWEALDSVGVFKLPRYRGGIPPEDKPSLRLTAEGRTWIFMRPSDVPAELSSDPAERAEIQAAWGKAKLLIVEFSLR